MDPLQPTFNNAQEWPETKKASLPELLHSAALAAGQPGARPGLKNWLNPTVPALKLPIPPSSPPAFTPPAPSVSLAVPPPPPAFPPVGQIPQSLTPVLPALIRLIQETAAELTRSPHSLLSLNPSRKDALIQHLCRLAGVAVPNEPTDVILRQWIEGAVSPAQIDALKIFREEVALICLGQALLLKAWADKGFGRFTEADLGRLNWAISNALKPHLPLNREGCLLTRPNLYSWFNPSLPMQKEIWNLLSGWNLKEEGPALLAAALNLCRKAPIDVAEPRTFDSRFFSKIWESMRLFGLDPHREAAGPIPRKRVFFSPTLREGGLVQSGPHSAQWIGLESDPFRLLSAELSYLWWKPSPPPLWGVGTGLEVHTREQLAMEWNSAKPSLLSQIAEMEACDLAWVLEERSTRLHQKTAAATRFRAHLETLPYFRKLRSTESSLGALQACVALSKLRPGGLLWWIREEPLSPREGHEALRFLFDRARLVCEWDASAVSHSLPTQQPLFSKYVYLFERDPEVERRRAHRPLSVKLSGSIRSHIEVPLFLNDLITSAQDSVTPRGQWEIARHRSSTAQQEWPEHWPSSASQDCLQKLDRLREQSAPLGQFATIRQLSSGQLSSNATGLGLSPNDHSGSFILVAHAAHSRGTDAPELQLLTLSPPEKGTEREVHPTYDGEFLVGLPNAEWVAPIRIFLESPLIREWLDCHAEKKGSRWILKESTVKYLPIPKSLLDFLANRGKPGSPELSFSGLFRDLEENPSAAIEGFKRAQAGASPESTALLRAALFSEAAWARGRLIESQKGLLSLVHPSGQIYWRGLMQILPKSECIPFPRHPAARLVGSLAAHLPIDRIQRIHSPSPAILFSTESGLNLQVRIDDAFLMDVLWEQVRGLEHSTWSELATGILLPRENELARATASDILKSYAREQARLSDLNQVLETSLPNGV